MHYCWVQAVPNNINSKFVVMLFTRGGVGDFRGCGDGPLQKRLCCIILMAVVGNIELGKGVGEWIPIRFKMSKQRTNKTQAKKQKQKQKAWTTKTNQPNNKQNKTHTQKKRTGVCYSPKHLPCRLTIQVILPLKVKIQYVHFRSHAAYFLLPWK